LRINGSVLIAILEIVPPQRVPGKPFPEQQTLQIRMTFKSDAHKVIDLSLLEIGCTP